MDPRHGPLHAFTERRHPDFSLLTQPILYVRLRAAANHSWSPAISALVDTGATITLIKHDYVRQIPGLDPASLGPELRWSSATGAATCRSAGLDLLLGATAGPRSPLLAQRPIYFTTANLPAPILLGQRGVLDSLRLIHANGGPRPGFRFVSPE